MCFKNKEWLVTLEVGPHQSIQKVVNTPSRVMAGKKAVSLATSENYRSPMVVNIVDIKEKL
jgi:hypothetical protein